MNSLPPSSDLPRPRYSQAFVEDRTIRAGWVFVPIQGSKTWWCDIFVDKPKSHSKSTRHCTTRHEAIANAVELAKAWEDRWEKSGVEWRNGLPTHPSSRVKA